jgi:hypothetical protein
VVVEEEGAGVETAEVVVEVEVGAEI